MINRMQGYRAKASDPLPLTDKHDSKSDISKIPGLLPLEEFVKTHPIAAISVGLLAGLTLGWWVKRK